MNIIKAIIPAAGFGTRLLPLTKAIPKEMIPLLTKPTIQYVVEETMASGISQCVIITTSRKQAIANYFSPDIPLQQFLKKNNKEALLEGVQKIIDTVTFSYLFQEEAKGLGHAIWLARDSIGNNYSAILLPDDIVISQNPAIKQLMQVAYQQNATVIAIQEMPTELISSYGVIGVKKQLTTNIFEVASLIEKPAASDAPSNLAIIGRYILSPFIFTALEESKPNAHGELQLTDALAAMLAQGHPIYAVKIEGTRYDVGTPSGWLTATMQMALADPFYKNFLHE